MSYNRLTPSLSHNDMQDVFTSQERLS